MWQSWADRQIREAQARGDFDNLPGKGKPIAGLDEPYDEMWWVKQWLRRENLSVLPPTLTLRREVEQARELALSARTEAAVRAIVAGINAKIVEANRKPADGPPTNLMPLDVERVVGQWRAAQASPALPKD